MSTLELKPLIRSNINHNHFCYYVLCIIVAADRFICTHAYIVHIRAVHCTHTHTKKTTFKAQIFTPGNTQTHCTMLTFAYCVANGVHIMHVTVQPHTRVHTWRTLAVMKVKPVFVNDFLNVLIIYAMYMYKIARRSPLLSLGKTKVTSRYAGKFFSHLERCHFHTQTHTHTHTHMLQGLLHFYF